MKMAWRWANAARAISTLFPAMLFFPGTGISLCRNLLESWEWAENASLLEKTASPNFDAIYFTGGQPVMYDFPDSEGLHRITRAILERGGRRRNPRPMNGIDINKLALKPLPPSGAIQFMAKVADVYQMALGQHSIP